MSHLTMTTFHLFLDGSKEPLVINGKYLGDGFVGNRSNVICEYEDMITGKYHKIPFNRIIHVIESDYENPTPPAYNDSKGIDNKPMM